MTDLRLRPWDRETAPPRVKAVLKALNRTQQQLADVMGVSFVTVNRWCNGKTLPDRRSQVMLEKLERAYPADDVSA
jgi:transcriptional regulator with XRE-family HTH domain